jgi:hypothetical protein
MWPTAKLEEFLSMLQRHHVIPRPMYYEYWAFDLMNLLNVAKGVKRGIFQVVGDSDA